MRNDTRLAFNDFVHQIAQLNGVPDATVKFSVAPSIQQKLETRIMESSDFLSKINMVPVVEQEGETLGLGISGAIAKRTNTATGTRREPVNVGQVDRINTYRCEKTEFDTAVRYAQLDMWARDPKFQEKLRDLILKQQGLDRILIGWHGTHVAATSDPVQYPLREDINKGWLQLYRDNAPARVMGHGAGGTGTTIKIGTGAGSDYNNLDALVIDAVNNLIDPLVRDDTSLVCIVGRQLMNDKLVPLVANTTAPTEIIAAQALMGQGRLGGLQPVRVPFFPEDAILITSLDNLSIYWQEGARRRSIRDEPEYDRIANYESSNDAYVVENYGAGCLIENIELL